jgi:hypothetical protein
MPASVPTASQRPSLRFPPAARCVAATILRFPPAARGVAATILRVPPAARGVAATILAGAAFVSAAAALTVMAASASGISPPSLNPLPPTAPLPTSATIIPSLFPDRLGAHAALTITMHFAGGEFGVPLPVRRSVLRLPARMSLEVPSLRSCSARRLRELGPAGCPSRSRLGNGAALAETHMGSQITSEQVSLSAFLGPPNNLQPTFEILAKGYTPLDEQIVFGGSVLADTPPYGEELVMSIPPVPTLPLEPDASIVTFSLTVGTSRGSHDRNTVLVPSRCPAGGFPFAAEFTYANGSDGSASASIPCP